MPSPEASRANGRKSRGPITEQGKRNSSRNSRRHGVYAKSIVFDHTAQARYSDALTTLTHDLQPTTAFESRLVATLALTQTRRRELWALEKSLIDSEIRRTQSDSPDVAAAYLTVLERGQLLNRLQTEESSCDRRFHQALSRLLESQANRSDKMLFSGTTLTTDTKQSPPLGSPLGYPAPSFRLK